MSSGSIISYFNYVCFDKRYFNVKINAQDCTPPTPGTNVYEDMVMLVLKVQPCSTVYDDMVMLVLKVLPCSLSFQTPQPQSKV